jgi:Protein of unknown function (DUF2946)
VGMLLHAATVARHHLVQYEAISAQAALQQALDAGLICHIDSDADEDDAAQALPGKAPGGAAKPCPVCLGLASAHALPASEAPALRVPQTVAAAAFVSPDREPAPPARFRLPPNRGPPSIG